MSMQKENFTQTTTIESLGWISRMIYLWILRVKLSYRRMNGRNKWILAKKRLTKTKRNLPRLDQCSSKDKRFPIFTSKKYVSAPEILNSNREMSRFLKAQIHKFGPATNRKSRVRTIRKRFLTINFRRKKRTINLNRCKNSTFWTAKKSERSNLIHTKLQIKDRMPTALLDDPITQSIASDMWSLISLFCSTRAFWTRKSRILPLQIKIQDYPIFRPLWC